MARRQASDDMDEVAEEAGPQMEAVRINVLGAGQEVGRSCVVVSYM